LGNKILLGGTSHADTNGLNFRDVNNIFDESYHNDNYNPNNKSNSYNNSIRVDKTGD